MTTRKTLLTTGAITAFSFALAFGVDGAATGSAANHAEKENGSEVRLGQQQQREFGASAAYRGQKEEARQSHKASDLKGKQVKIEGGDNLGTVEDLAVNLETGELAYLLVSAENDENGDQWKPIPPEAVQIQSDNGDVELLVSIEKEQWENAPTVSENELAQLGEEHRAREIYRAFGQEYEGNQHQQMQFGAPDRDRQHGQTPGAGMDRDRDEARMTSPGMGQESQTEFGAPQRHNHGQHDTQAQGRAGAQDGQTEFGAAQRHDHGQAGQQHDTQAQDRTGAQEGQTEFGAPQRHNHGQHDTQAQDRQGAGMQDQVRQYGAEQREQTEQFGQQQRNSLEQFGQEQRDQAQQYGAAQRDRAETGAQDLRDWARDGRDQERPTEFGAAQRDRGEIRRASDLMDVRVNNLQQEEIGKITDLVLNVEDGSVQFVLIESEEHDATFAVSPDALQSIRDDEARLNVTGTALEQARELRSEDLNQDSGAVTEFGAALRGDTQVYRLPEGDQADRLFGARDRKDEEKDKEEKDRDSDS